MSITVRLWSDEDLAKTSTDDWLLTVLANGSAFSGLAIQALNRHQERLKTYVCNFPEEDRDPDIEGEWESPEPVTIRATSPTELKRFIEAEYTVLPESIFEQKTDFIPVRLESYKLDRKIILESQIEHYCRLYNIRTGDTVQHKPCDVDGNPLWSLDDWLETFTEGDYWESNAIPTNIDEVFEILTELLEQMGFEVTHVQSATEWQIGLDHPSDMPYSVASNMLADIGGYLPAEGVSAF